MTSPCVRSRISEDRPPLFLGLRIFNRGGATPIHAYAIALRGKQALVKRLRG